MKRFFFTLFLFSIPFLLFSQAETENNDSESAPGVQTISGTTIISGSLKGHDIFDTPQSDVGDFWRIADGSSGALTLDISASSEVKAEIIQYTNSSRLTTVATTNVISGSIFLLNASGFYTLVISDTDTGIQTFPYNVSLTFDASPIFENSTPSASSVAETGFTLNTDIHEAGTIYYVVVADGATAPTSAEVKAGTASGGGSAVTSGNAAVTTGGFSNTFGVTGLTAGTAYDVYVVAEDDEGTPNIQTSPTKIDVTTLKPLASIVITEIMYNLPGTNDAYEYIELYNAGSSVVDLTGYSFSRGVAHTFTSGSIAPGEYFVITDSTIALNTAFGAGTADAQWTSGALSNGGEDIELIDDASRVVDYVDYDDNAPWPTEPDGLGPSIRLNDLTSDNNVGSNWSASTESTGILISGVYNEFGILISDGVEVKGTPGSAGVFDTTPPVFENSTPSSSSIGQTSFTLSTDIDEAGTIYYVVVADGATAPTSAEVKAETGNGGSGQVTSGNAGVTTGGFTNAFSVAGLTAGTAYDVYVVAEDDGGTPNIQTSPTKIDVTTMRGVEFETISSNGIESTSSANIEVTLSSSSTNTITVDYTVTGTATGTGTDYTLADGTLTFTPSEISKNITIANIINDTENEANETVIITLSNPVNASLGTNTTHTYTINDDEITTATAGADQNACGSFTFLGGNTPNAGFSESGSWSIISGTGGSLGTANSPTSSFSGTAGTAYTLRWTISDGTASPSTDDVVITLFDDSTPSSAGPDQNVFGLTTTLSGNTISGPNATGTWTQVAGPGVATFGDANSSTSTATISSFGSYTFRWTSSNGPCLPSTDDVTITFTVPPYPAFENGTPSATSITSTGFTLQTDIDEAGTIYYVVLTDGATAPTSIEVKDAGGCGVTGQITEGNTTVSTGNFTYDFFLSGFPSNRSYDVYVVAEDSIGNLQTNPTKIEITTLNTPPSFSSTASTTVNEGDIYTYTITTNDADGDNVTVTAPTKPSWLSLTSKSAGNVTTFAGSGAEGSANGNGTAASFKSPRGISIDASGNLYIADLENHLIRKITSDGDVTTFAGSGASGSANGNGTAATFSFPTDLALDPSENVYVADVGNQLIRKITPSGDVTTFAGSGASGSANGNGTAASFNGPTGMAVDASGNVYVADANNNLIRKIAPNGDVTTLAGSGASGSANGNGTAASFSGPTGVTVDASGNVYVADRANHLIRKITPNGNVTTLAGSGASGSANGYGAAASFFNPSGIALDASENVYVADQNNHLIRKIAPNGDVTTLAGSGSSGSADGNGTAATFAQPSAVVLGESGMYVVDLDGHLIRKVVTKSNSLLTGNSSGQAGDHNVVLEANDGNGGVVQQSFTISVVTKPTVTSSAASTITANGVTLNGNVTADGGATITERGFVYAKTSDDATPTLAEVNGTTVFKVVVTGTTGAYNQAIASLTANSGYSFVAYATNSVGTTESAVQTFTTTNTTPTFTSTAVTSVNEGDTYTYNITANDADGDGVTVTAPTLPSWLSLNTTRTVSTFAGSGTSAEVDGTGTAASFTQPTGIAIDQSNNLYVMDIASYVIRKVTPQGVVTTFAGTGSSGSSDGVGTAASFGRLVSGDFDAAGNLFVVDRTNRTIRKVTPAGVVTTFVGGGSGDGVGTAAGFGLPIAIAIDRSSGNMYVVDENTIRKITSAGVVTTLAGSTGVSGDVDGLGTAARFNQAWGVAVDASGNIYVADQANEKIKKITSAGVVTTFAGGGSGDGIGTAAGFSFPGGLYFDNDGNLLVTEEHGAKVRKITLAAEVTTIAGTGGSGSVDGDALSATFSGLRELVVGAAGNIFVTEASGRKIRKISNNYELTGNTEGNGGVHNVVLEANDGNGGTVQQAFTVTVVAQPTVSLSVDNASIDETSGTATLTATLSKVWANDVIVNLGYTGTAVNGTDYNSTASTSITITAGQTSADAAVIITPVNDTDLEIDETIIVDITGVTNAKEDGVQQQTITISSDESASLSVDTITKAENADGGATTDFTFTVTLTGAVGECFSVDYATADIYAVAGTDYTATSGQLDFTGNDGETQQFTVTVNNDDIAEFDETFSVQFSNLQAGGLPITLPSPSIATIDNDDTAILTIADVSGNEDDGAITVTVALDKEVQDGVIIAVSTADGSATVANSDYTAVSLQQISFTGTAGETKTFTLTPTVDTTTEFDETLTVSMQLPQRNGSARVDASDTATITITNDDLATITIADVSANEDDGPITVTATLDNDIQGGFTIAVSTADGTATLANNDYTALVSQFVAFTGTAGETQTFTVTPTADTVAEDNETVSIFMQIPVRSSSQIVDVSDTATVTILDDDLIPAVITFADISKTYGDADFDLGATSNSTGTISYSIIGAANGTSLSGTNNATVTLGNVGTVTIRATLPADGTYDSGTKDITLTISKATLTVTADDKSKIYGDANPALTVSYAGFQNGDDASVLDTAPTSSTTATTTTDVGTQAITASGGVDNNYNFSYVSGTLTINKATLTVTADDQSKVYGDANPSLTVSYSGFKGTDDASVLDTAPTASTTADVTTSVGTPTVTASGGVDNNYVFSYVTGTLTITQRPITITADDKTKERTTADPVFTYMITNGDLATGDSFTGDLTRDAGEASGTYAITQGTLTAGSNYNLTFVSGTLTIEDTIAPNPPQVTHISDYTCVGNVTKTGDNTLEISGTAEAGSTVEVFEDGASIGIVTATNAGFFTFDHTGTTLADGTYNFTVTATDVANNTSTLSAPLTITIDSLDTDGDGLPDFCDDDYDGNGTLDVEEDCDNDGIVDHLDSDISSCTSAILETKQYGFSPNGDGINDGWFVENITAYPNSLVQVFNRSGKLVFKKKGYQNDWEGNSNQISSSGTGVKLPVGPYLFIIDLGNGSKPTRGWIYINY